METQVSPFEQMAADYDALFTHTPLGTLMRAAVWRRLEARFRPGDRILELACGTGEDALFLARRGVDVLALDAAEAMVAITRKKAREAGLEQRVKAVCAPIERLGAVVGQQVFVGALSNFGGLNCVEDLGGVARDLALCIRPGGIAALCIMGPTVPWEWAWHLYRLQFGKAFRRMRRGGLAWRGMHIWYPSLGAAKRAFAPEFRPVRATALGALLPPPYTEAWANRHLRLVKLLNQWERRLETCPPLPSLADHYLLELERV